MSRSPRVICVRLAFPNFLSDYESMHTSLLALLLHNRVVEKRGSKDLRKVWNPSVANQRYILIYNIILVRRKEDCPDITMLVDHKPCDVSLRPQCSRWAHPHHSSVGTHMVISLGSDVFSTAGIFGNCQISGNTRGRVSPHCDLRRASRTSLE